MYETHGIYLYFMYLENRLFGLPKVQEAYNIIFWFLMENSILKIFGSMDVKITPDFCSKQLAAKIMDTSSLERFRDIQMKVATKNRRN